MTMLLKARVSLLLLAILVLGLLPACNSSTSIVQTSDGLAKTQNQPVQSSRVEVVYFHMSQRCATCLCFEERIVSVVKTYFQNEIDSGKLVFRIIALGDKQTAEVARKYNAIGSQLFINTVIDGADSIVDIQDIWKWRCLADKSGFDDRVRSIIVQSLEEVD